MAIFQTLHNGKVKVLRGRKSGSEKSSGCGFDDFVDHQRRLRADRVRTQDELADGLDAVLSGDFNLVPAACSNDTERCPVTGMPVRSDGREKVDAGDGVKVVLVRQGGRISAAFCRLE